MNKAELIKVLDEAINQIRHNDLRLAVMCIGRAKAIVEGKDDWMDDKDNNMPSKDFVVTGVQNVENFNNSNFSFMAEEGEPKEQKVERGVVWPEKLDILARSPEGNYRDGWNACLEKCKRLNKENDNG